MSLQKYLLIPALLAAGPALADMWGSVAPAIPQIQANPSGARSALGLGGDPSVGNLTTQSHATQTTASAPVNVIIDDDCTNDVDCAYTLSDVHHWIDTGNVNVLAFIADSGTPYAAPVFKIWNAYYNHASIPVGAWKGTAVTGTYGTSNWNSGTVSQFDAGDTVSNYPDCVTTYRTALAKAAGSVAIAETGFLTCIQALMQSSADGISPLTGPQLIAAKVRGLYIMGGDYPTGNEFNMMGAPSAANYVFANWNTQSGYPPIYLNGFTPGFSVISGKPSWFSSTDPAVYAQALFGTTSRPSWDALSVYQAIFGTGAFTISANGTNVVNASTGANTWSSGTASGHYYLTLANAASYYSALLDGQVNAGANLYGPQSRPGTATLPGLQCNAFGCAVGTAFHINSGVTGGIFINHLGDLTYNLSQSILAPNISSGHQLYSEIGQSESTNNAGSVGFTYNGAGSALNTLDFNFYGTGKLLQLTAGGNVLLNTHLELSPTTPTISSGFGTSPVASGTANAPNINVGTGGSASSGVIGLPTAYAGWNCSAQDVTTPATNDTKITGSTVSSVTLTNYSHTTATPQAWASGDIVKLVCFPY